LLVGDEQKGERSERREGSSIAEQAIIKLYMMMFLFKILFNWSFKTVWHRRTTASASESSETNKYYWLQSRDPDENEKSIVGSAVPFV